MDTGNSDSPSAVGETEARGSWLQRNWKWAFPLAMVLMIAGALSFTVLMLTVVMHPAKNSRVYHDSVQRVAAHPIAIEQLGAPIEAQWLVTGRSEETAGGRGVAELTIPLSGSRRDGALHVIGRRREGVWQITRMELEIDDSSRRYDLLATENVDRSAQ